MPLPAIFPLLIFVPHDCLSFPSHTLSPSYLLLLSLHGDLAGWGSVGRQDKTACLPAPAGEIVGWGEPHPSPPHTPYPFTQLHASPSQHPLTLHLLTSQHSLPILSITTQPISTLCPFSPAYHTPFTLHIFLNTSHKPMAST
ncbi:hypothetical protein Pmani_039162 [Petrolisthes manimaculis]|uniref:Uncharacterized protein n=1 Tax=Petrolisthes manimaculis TaxID=1843537 RepID=A0AAE1TJJ1_9EUCA|nr:hypothetical protein Pmani_039162 [Petrolisthes manimaculis]